MTAQIPDLFEWQGETLPVEEGCAPPTDDPGIEPCFAAASLEEMGDLSRLDPVTRARFEERERRTVEHLARINAERCAKGLRDMPRVSASFANSTACYRRYIATWGVEEGRLVLKKLEGSWRLLEGRALPVPFTGRFLLGRGKSEPYAFEPSYSEHLELRFEAGRLIPGGATSAPPSPAATP